jgi:hypothetical protein
VKCVRPRNLAVGTLERNILLVYMDASKLFLKKARTTGLLFRVSSKDHVSSTWKKIGERSRWLPLIWVLKY